MSKFISYGSKTIVCEPSKFDQEFSDLTDEMDGHGEEHGFTMEFTIGTPVHLPALTDNSFQRDHIVVIITLKRHWKE